MSPLKEISVFCGMSPTELLSEITVAYLGIRRRVASMTYDRHGWRRLPTMTSWYGLVCGVV